MGVTKQRRRHHGYSYSYSLPEVKRSVDSERYIQEAAVQQQVSLCMTTINTPEVGSDPDTAVSPLKSLWTVQSSTR